MNETKENSLQTTKLRLIEEVGECEICRYDYKAILQIHHITPLSLGGNDELENLVILCPNCHKTIHSIDSRFSENNFGIDYIDDWMDENLSTQRKQVYLNYATEILRGRYMNAGLTFSSKSERNA